MHEFHYMLKVYIISSHKTVSLVGIILERTLILEENNSHFVTENNTIV